jgi:hypothetical protein
MPGHRRKESVYITKSLKIWVLAIMLKKVGFETSASPILVVSDADYTVAKSQTRKVYADVMLTVSRAPPSFEYKIDAAAVLVSGICRPSYNLSLRSRLPDCPPTLLRPYTHPVPPW